MAFGRLARYGRPWMVWAAAMTYPVYLLHDEFSNVLFTRWHSLNRWVLLVVVLAIVGAASWVVHVAVERPMGPRLKVALDKGWDRVQALRARGGHDSARRDRSVPAARLDQSVPAARPAPPA
jgi:peptidoglycan/LPS O-acetylase OafA/YrhL